MAYLREVFLRLDPFREDIVYERIPVMQYNAYVERVYTRKSPEESATPVAVIRDTGIPEPKVTIEGTTWNTPYYLTLVCIRKRGANVELPDDAGRLLGVVSDPRSSWFLCTLRTQPQAPQPQPPSETDEPRSPASPEYV